MEDKKAFNLGMVMVPHMPYYYYFGRGSAVLDFITHWARFHHRKSILYAVAFHCFWSWTHLWVLSCWRSLSHCVIHITGKWLCHFGLHRKQRNYPLTFQNQDLYQQPPTPAQTTWNSLAACFGWITAYQRSLLPFHLMMTSDAPKQSQSFHYASQYDRICCDYSWNFVHFFRFQIFSFLHFKLIFVFNIIHITTQRSAEKKILERRRILLIWYWIFRQSEV